jgi:hypothetical protein
MKRGILKTVTIALLFLAPTVAQADLISAWVGAKGAHISGTGGVFENIDSNFGGGVEAGLEVLGMEFMAEGFILGADQYMFTGNFGFDVGFDLGVRISAGAYIGVIGFVMPEPESSGINIPADIRTRLGAGGDQLADAIESGYNDAYGDQASELEKYAFGGQARLRLQLDYAIVPFVYVGAEGSVGYHLMFSGDDATAAAKSAALDEALKDAPTPVPEDLKADLKTAVGAEDPNVDDLNGTNYNVGVYIKLEF